MNLYRQKVKDSLVLDFVLSLELRFVKRQSGNSSGLALSDNHCEFELSNVSSGLFNENWEGDQKFMFKALLDTDSGSYGVFEGVETEAERWVSVKHFIEELSALLDFKVV